jgi:hypothetical protein
MVMNDELRRLVLERSPADAIARAAIAGGMQTLQKDAFVKVREGETTLDELKRILAQMASVRSRAMRPCASPDRTSGRRVGRTTPPVGATTVGGAAEPTEVRG